MRLTKLSYFVAFIVFGGATLSQFLFDIFAHNFISGDVFREAISARAIIIMCAPIILLGIDQALIRFGAIPAHAWLIYKFFFWISLLIITLSLLLFTNVIEYIYIVFAAYLYSYGVLVGSKLRVSGNNIGAQICISLWKLFFHLSIILLSIWFVLEKQSVYPVLISALLIPILIGENVKKVQVIGDSVSNNEFSTYSFIFLFFILMLGASQYIDQLYASIVMNDELLRLYIALIAVFIAPSTVLATFLGFILAPIFAKESVVNVKLAYKKYIKLTLLAFPFVFLFTYLLYKILVSYELFPSGKVHVDELILLYLIALLRLVYCINSAVMGMKSGKKSLFYFFLACVLGLGLQCAILLFMSNISLVIILFSVFINWLVRNVSAAFLIERTI